MLAGSERQLPDIAEQIAVALRLLSVRILKALLRRFHERHHLSDRAHRGDHGHSVIPRLALDDPSGGIIVITETETVIVAAEDSGKLRWGGIIAGAICASALALVLHAFAGAVGVSLSSAAPTWRDSSAALVLLSGLYLILVALASYGFGAYIAARLRAPSTDTSEIGEFRNGVDGLLVWALATLLTGI